MELRIIMILAGLAPMILVGGCRSFGAAHCREHRTPTLVRDYLERQDYDQMNEYMEHLDLLAQSKLQVGMSKDKVRKVMGPPLSDGPLNERVEMWSYAPSISTTFEYWVIFVDEKLDFFGVAQTTWLWDRYSTQITNEN